MNVVFNYLVLGIVFALISRSMGHRKSIGVMILSAILWPIFLIKFLFEIKV